MYLKMLSWIMVLITVASSTEAPLPDSVYNMAPDEVEIVRLTYDCRFDDAFALARQMNRGVSNPLRDQFIKAMISWRNFFYRGSAFVRDTLMQHDFAHQMRKVVGEGDSLLDKNASNPEALFYTGAGYGYLGELEASNGNYFKSASLGQKALSYHEKLLSIDPEYYDAYLTLGLFNFYASSVPWFLKPILFILGKSGSEKKAEEYLILASTKGRLAKYEAREGLALLYARQGKTDSVESIYHGLSTELPDAKLFYETKLTSALAEMKCYSECINECTSAIEASRMLMTTRFDSLQVGLIYVDLAYSYESLHRYNDAIRAYGELLSRGIANKFDSWVHLSLGRLHESALEKGDAVKEYRWVIERSTIPEHLKEARDRLDDLGDEP